MTEIRKICLKYAPDYNAGKAEIVLDANDFCADPKEYNPSLARLGAGILATANDHIGQLGRARYLAPALDRDLQFRDISIFHYPRCRYQSENVTMERLGRKPLDFAFSISHYPMQAKTEEFELVLLTLRGTESLTEGIVTDFIGTVNKRKTVDWCGHPAYTAFTYYAKKVFYGLMQYMQRYKNTFRYRKMKYFILGHSLGGAAAQLVAAKLSDMGKAVFCYTYASLNPLTTEGDGKYSNIWNLYNYYDNYGPKGRGAFGYRPAGGGS